MALTRITEGVIKPNENYVVNNINSSGVTTSTNFKTGTSLSLIHISEPTRPY